ncbi:MAG: hypothetical protein ABEJ98_02760 [Candidatus Nanohaloarchaea archaeon]
MDQDAVFRRYDIRGEYGNEIDEEFARLLGKATGTFAHRRFSGEVTVSRDNKTSSVPLKKELIKGIRSTGADVYDAGEGPTDYAALTGRRFGTPTVQVTSSHLPLNSNGFKLMYPAGNGFKNTDLDRIEELFRNRDFREGSGNYTRVEKASKNYYRKRLLESGRGPGAEKTVVVETMGGAARKLLPQVLAESGAEVIDLARGKPEGPYFDPPRPDPEILENVEKAVEEHGADLGVATDMDADRAAVYFNGRWITGDELFGILAQLFESPEVVASVDTSEAVEEVVRAAGGAISYTRVGDPFVVDQALKADADLAGEPNGHYCFPKFVPYNSGILTCLTASNIRLEELLEKIPEYTTLEEDVKVAEKEEVLSKVVEKARQSFSIVSEVDGVKYVDGDATVLIRSSGSSPIIRVKAESRDRSEARRALEAAVKLVRNQ